jgi:hypothetical protein
VHPGGGRCATSVTAVILAVTTKTNAKIIIIFYYLLRSRHVFLANESEDVSPALPTSTPATPASVPISRCVAVSISRRIVIYIGCVEYPDITGGAA